ncbi:hypothetical protein [Acidovorax sp. LjRoot117]|uniref:hypothetical protein n=1 Tax=Acidovorax sp. LjRoot117 TaxID=3342255 RepID=UPI003ECC4F56
MSLQISSPTPATILLLYCKGARRPFAGKAHECTGDLTVVRLEGRFGTVPALHLASFTPQRLFEPRIVDMVSGALEVHGLEKTPEGDWVAQAWRLKFE